MYKKITLDNGLRIVAHRMGQRESLALGIWLNVGGRFETPQNKGISHFLEHLLFKAPKNIPAVNSRNPSKGWAAPLTGSLPRN